MNADELFEFLGSLEGARDAGSKGNGVVRSRLVGGVEYGQAREVGERKLRAAFKRRAGGGATPLVLIGDQPDAEGQLAVLGPDRDGPVRSVRAASLRDLIAQTTAMSDLAAVRHVAAEIGRLDAGGVPGLVVRGLGTEHLYRTRLRETPRWRKLAKHAAATSKTDWRDVLAGLGYELTRLPKRGYLATAGGRPAITIHPKRSQAEFARLDEQARLPEGALLADCDSHGTPYGILAAGSRMRLLRASGEEAGQATRYLELDAALIEPDDRPLLGLLAPAYLAGEGFADVLAESRDYGAKLRLRLDRALRQAVLPVLGRELGRWAQAEGMDTADDRVRAELEAAALTFVFRALFLLYAESAGYLPMSNQTYAQRSMTRTADRAAAELESADPRSTSLWRDVSGLVEAMRTGQTAWGVPPYNGALFGAADFDGAEILERASIPDAALAPALLALARDPDKPEVGVDYSGLEIGHLGHIYEGLLSLRLSIADRRLRYDERADRYLAAEDEGGNGDVIEPGELLWLTNEGGRKGGGVYYTRSELVRHLVRNSVRPAFAAHLAKVRELAGDDPGAAAKLLFDFYVLDPACGSAHFLVEVVEELADQIAELLGEVALPAVRDVLGELRATAGRTFSAEVEDAALLKRLALKRCVYGVDLSPMGAEIAKVSLWLATFVPGLSLAYLDHNVQVGNSLIGVARPDALEPDEEERGTGRMFGDPVTEAISDAAIEAARLREIADRTPDEVEASIEAAAALAKRVEGAKRVFDLWTAEPLGLDAVELHGTSDDGEPISPRRAVAIHGPEIVEGKVSTQDDPAREIADEQRSLHWPIAFAEAFARENPGFDIVVGNPPWEEVTVEELAFYARYKPGLRGLPESERRTQLAELKDERPALEEMLGAERERLAALRRYLGAASGYAGSAGDPDVYKYFCQRYRQLLREDGRIGVVLPRSAFLAKGSAGFREWLFDEAAPRRLDFLLNAGRWAFDAEPRYTVALLAAERRAPKRDEDFEVAGVAASAAEFAAQAESPGLVVRREALGPDLEVPLLPTQEAADLLAKLRTGEPFPHGCRRWRCFPTAEFHETNDSSLWEGAADGWPLWKGESFDQFDPHGAEARTCPPSKEALAKAAKPRPGSGSLLSGEVPVGARREAVARTVGRARVAFRDVTRATDSRTVRACLVPPEHFLLNSAPYLAFIDDDPRAEAACLALMNSLAFDWQARRFVETHVNFFILEGLRLPDLDDATFDALATAAARLSCTDERFADFAAATDVECVQLSDEERTHLRVEIDAQVARVWDLTPDELEVIFEDFTTDAVPEDYRQAVRDRFAEPA